MEGLNNKIGVIKHRAYGFHSFAALAAMVFLFTSNYPFDVGRDQERLVREEEVMR